jgi:hypothetical protein
MQVKVPTIKRGIDIRHETMRFRLNLFGSMFDAAIENHRPSAYLIRYLEGIPEPPSRHHVRRRTCGHVGGLKRVTLHGDTASTADSAGSIPTGRSKVNARTYGGLPVDAHRSQRDDFQILWRIVRIAMRNRVRLAIAVAATLGGAAFQLLIPQLLGDAVDSALGLLDAASASPEAAREALFLAAILLLGASVLRGLFTLVHNYAGESIGHHLAYDLRLAFYDKLQQLSFSFHDRVHTGELITRGMLDLEGVRMFVNTGVLRVLLLVVLIFAGAWLLLSADLLPRPSGYACAIYGCRCRTGWRCSAASWTRTSPASAWCAPSGRSATSWTNTTWPPTKRWRCRTGASGCASLPHAP